MSNNITIKFIADGDKELIKAFKDLANAQNKFNKATKSASNTTKQQENAHRKLDAGMMRLRASFKAQNKSLMDAGVSAKLYKQALLGNVVAQEKVRLSVKKYNQDLADANIATRILGGSVAVLRSKMLVAAFAIGMVKKPFTDLISAYSRATEVGGKFDVVFGETRDVADQFARSLGKNFGRATTDIKEFMSSLQDTFVPLGFARIESAKLSAGLTELALDVASFNNKMDADVVRDFQSAIVGNHETVKKYGIIINEATIKQKALAMGLIENVKDLSEYDKVLARVAIMQQGTADAQGDVIRTFDTLANSVKAAQAEFTAFKEEFGEILEPLAMFLLEIGELAMNLLRLIKLPLQALTTAFGAFGQILNSVNIIIGGFFDLFKKDVPELDKAKEALNSLNNEIFIFSDGVKKASTDTPAFSLQVQSLIDSFKKSNAPIMVFSNNMNNLDKMYSKTKQGKAFYLQQQIQELEALGNIGEGYDDLKIVISHLKDEYESFLNLQIKTTEIIKESNDTITASFEKIDGFTIPNQNLKASFADMAALIIMESDSINNSVRGVASAMTKLIMEGKSLKKLKLGEILAQIALQLALTSAFGGFAGLLTGKSFISGALGALGTAHKGGHIQPDGSIQRFARGGVIKGEDNVPILAQAGEFVMSRNAVEAIGVENLNRMNQGGSGAVNITFTGNVMSQDFIENEAIPQIKDAIRRGADIGVS